MPSIRLHPKIADYFVHMDWRDAEGCLPEFSTKLVENLEAGKVILLANARFQIDYEILNRVTVPPDGLFKKKKAGFFLYPKLHRHGVAKVFWQTFRGNLLLYLRFRREVARVTGQVHRLVDQIFPTYRFLSRDVSWRFTRTGPEPLHLDSFGENGDYQWVRVFVNLDEEPRVWAVGLRLEDVAERYYESAGLAEFRDVSANEFCYELNEVAFNGPDGPEQPRHVVHFEQGDVWLCDSRIVSHQIVAGRRLLATHMKVDPESMLDPSQRVEARVQRIHQRHAPEARSS
jgi:hypothetical protein